MPVVGLLSKSIDYMLGLCIPMSMIPIIIAARVKDDKEQCVAESAPSLSLMGQINTEGDA